MNNFALFAGENYEAGGGMQDLVGLYDSIDEAIAAAKDTSEYRHDWFQVVDSQFSTVVSGWLRDDAVWELVNRQQA